MGTCHIQALMFYFLLGASSLTLAQHLECFKSISTSIEANPSNTFNWTTEEVETCDNGSFCQETVLMIKAGAETAVLATKGCVSEGAEAMTFIQHTAPPGLITVSYSGYCEDSFCNNKDGVYQFWQLQRTPASGVSGTLRCPTCVALGSCFSAPSLPCPNGTTRCYQGKLDITGGGINSSVEVKGCTSMIGCRLMARIFTVGPMLVKEVCPRQSLTEPRMAEDGATWIPISVWGLELLLPLLLQSFVLLS
ncbi:testis-expressed protein 101 [Cynocephalus volans]|uniref:testis-expressed protein 101 n=1 Tax=Cynocephalus volans TaxID=110931 RepID=UPI002FC97762